MDNINRNTYYDNIDDFNDSLLHGNNDNNNNSGSGNENNNNNNNTLNILQWNVRGMNDLSKFDEILQTLDNCHATIDVLVIGETWLKPENCSLYQIPQYNAIFSCRQQSYGGLTLYIRNNIAHRVIKNTTNNGFHHIQAELEIKGHYYDVHGVYRPPSFDFNDFLTQLEHMMVSASPNHSCFIVGDMNVPINLSNNNVVVRYKTMLESYNFACTNTIPTRPTSSNILDHVVCRLDDICYLHNYTIFNDLSDHLQIISTFKLQASKENMTLVKRIVDHRKLQREFNRFIDSIGVIVDPESTIVNIIDTYNSLLTQCTKTIIKHVKLKSTLSPWMTFDLWTLIRIKNNYLKHAKCRPNDQHIKQMLQHISRKVDLMKKSCKKSYFENILLNTPHSKLWKNIKTIFGQSKQHDKISLISNGARTNNNKEICEMFNNFFSSIGHNLSGNIPVNPNLSPLDNVRHISDTIFLRPSTVNEVVLLINNLDIKKSSGPDNIPPSVLKNNSLSFASILSQCFNQILESGFYPDCLKIARVVPVFKSGDPCECTNYRPISTLSVFNKILEKMLVSRLLEFLDKHSVFYNLQYGFRQGCGTLTAIAELVDCISAEVDNKKLVGALFLDLKKAFDTLNHAILLNKLERYGIRGVANRVIASYLSNRKQLVTIEREQSALAALEVGVPQGSNIGPLLFLLYINDLGNLPLNGTPRLFADDTALFYPTCNVHTMIYDIESDLNTLKRFFDTNLLSLNLLKTKYMIFHPPRKTLPVHDNPKLEDQAIEKVSCFKYLGIHLDSTLSWVHHIAYVERHVASLCGVMWRVSTFVPRHVLLKFYFGYIHSSLNYLVLAWGRACSSYLKKLQVLQNRCLKTIFKRPLLYSTLLLYSDGSHNILPISYLSDLQTLLFVHDVLHNPKTHHNLHLTSATHSRMTRFSHNLQRARAATNLGEKRISIIGPTKYNLLPLDIKQITNRNIFKTRLKKHLKEKLVDIFH